MRRRQSPGSGALERDARALLADLAKAPGFDVFQKSRRNLFIRRSGRDDRAPSVLIGSHLDSQPAGRFDGALGTLSAFQVLESL
jgi:beta-ureidopropionase / N-carbamoyl-L-amino-acid hydrolase